MDTAVFGGAGIGLLASGVSMWQWQNKELIDDKGRCLATFTRDSLTVGGAEFAADHSRGPRLDVTMTVGPDPESAVQCSARTMGLTTSKLSVTCDDRGYVISRKKIVAVASGDVHTVGRIERQRLGRKVAIDWVDQVDDSADLNADQLFLAWVIRLVYGPGDLRV